VAAGSQPGTFGTKEGRSGAAGQFLAATPTLIPIFRGSFGCGGAASGRHSGARTRPGLSSVMPPKNGSIAARGRSTSGAVAWSQAAAAVPVISAGAVGHVVDRADDGHRVLGEHDPAHVTLPSSRQHSAVVSSAVSRDCMIRARICSSPATTLTLAATFPFRPQQPIMTAQSAAGYGTKVSDQR